MCVLSGPAMLSCNEHNSRAEHFLQVSAGTGAGVRGMQFHTCGATVHGWAAGRLWCCCGGTPLWCVSLQCSTHCVAAAALGSVCVRVLVGNVGVMLVCRGGGAGMFPLPKQAKPSAPACSCPVAASCLLIKSTHIMHAWGVTTSPLTWDTFLRHRLDCGGGSLVGAASPAAKGDPDVEQFSFFWQHCDAVGLAPLVH